MKILVATLSHTPDDDRVFHKQIRSLLRAGHEVTLATRNQPVVDLRLPRFQHVDLGPVGVVQFGAALQSLAEQWRPQALQIHEFTLLSAGGSIKKALGIPLIYDVQDTHPEMWATFSSKPPVIKQIINWGLLQFEKRQLKQVDVVLAASQLIASRYQQWGPATVFVPNYMPFHPLDLTVPRPPLVIYHGQLSVERGIGTLVRAFEGVIQQVPGAQLEIYGRERVPGFVQGLESSLDQSALRSAVRIRSAIPHQDILDRLKGAQIGVIPFLDRPLFRVAPPNKLFEYMLCGCAVVTSDLPVLRENGRDAVLFVPPGDGPALTKAIIEL
ncbi:MAG: glycosyltransferase, partial [Candidatus Marinimicrobia bacterium]|nr:glycosyltransferase [Candidatus Neomarinimicrobiota bacterium]